MCIKHAEFVPVAESTECWPFYNHVLQARVCTRSCHIAVLSVPVWDGLLVSGGAPGLLLLLGLYIVLVCDVHPQLSCCNNSRAFEAHYMQGWIHPVGLDMDQQDGHMITCDGHM